MNKSIVAAIASLALLLAACGTDDTADTAGTDTAAEALPTTAVDAEAETSDDVEAPADDEEAEAPATTVVDSTEETTDSVADDASTGVVRTATLGSSVLAPATDSQQTSARFEGTFTFSGGPASDFPGDVSMTVNGAYDLATNASDISIDLGQVIEAAMAGEAGAGSDMALAAAFFEDPIRVVTLDDKAWVSWGLISLFTGEDDVWLETEADGSSDLTAEFGFSGAGSPTGLLDSLRDANATIEELGTETIRGVETTHVRAIVDAEALAATMSPEERAEFENEVGTTNLSELPMEFWVDADGLLRRYRLDLSDPTMMADGDNSFEGAEIVFEMYDYGVDLDITAPPADKIITEDSLNFGG